MVLEDLALTMVRGLGHKGVIHLLETFGSAQAVFGASYDELRQRAELREDIAQSIVSRECFGLAEREIQYCQRHKIITLASTDPEYPNLLKQTDDYPHVLYIMGNPDALTQSCVSIVGTRSRTSYGHRVTTELVKGLAQRVPDLVIVSGLADGIDSDAHRAALDSGALTVAVLPTTLPDILPANNMQLARDIIKSGGALVSEFSSVTRKHMGNYIARNRIVAGLGAGLILVESSGTGGSLTTVKRAGDYGRSVMAIPGRVNDAMSFGPNMLISNGKARLVLSASDVLDELAWDFGIDPKRIAAQPSTPDLTAQESALLELMSKDEPTSKEQIAERSGLHIGEMMALLLSLEMAGKVRQLPGDRYERYE